LPALLPLCLTASFGFLSDRRFRDIGWIFEPRTERLMIHFVLHEAKDTVAVAVVEGIKAGADLTAWIMDDDKQISIRALQDIPIGHKIALKDMAVGDTVFKYGTDIGKVVAPIKAGEHAHVHNIKTKRW
jgi:(2R)-sulfolactate sulfo-lyase subunit alpha